MMSTLAHVRTLSLLFVGFSVFLVTSLTLEPSIAWAASANKKAMAPPKASPKRPPAKTLAEKYCLNIKDAAADARFVWQANTIKSMSKQLEDKIKELEARTEEYKTWLKRRKDFVKKATSSLIDIYAKMRPDAAAIQLKTLDAETASAILTQLKARTSSAILSEMDPTHAAKLASIIAGSAKVETGKGT